MNVAAFADELVKIAKAKKRKERYYQPHIIGHELGHARFWEKRGPVRTAAMGYGRLVGPVAGSLGALLLAAKGKPKAAVAVGAAGMAPTLIDEAEASVSALRRMRKSGRFSKAQLGEARKDLGLAFGTYATALGGTTLASGIQGHFLRKRPYGIGAGRAKNVAMIGAAGLNLALMGSLLARRNKTQTITPKEAEELKKDLGVKTKIVYTKNLGPAYIGKSSPRGVGRTLARWQLEPEIPNRRDLKQVLDEGAVLMPKEWGGTKRARLA